MISFFAGHFNYEALFNRARMKNIYLIQFQIQEFLFLVSKTTFFKVMNKSSSLKVRIFITDSLYAENLLYIQNHDHQVTIFYGILSSKFEGKIDLILSVACNDWAVNNRKCPFSLKVAFGVI